MALNIPNALFALTFPGTILYYVAISMHVIPPIGAGYFGLMCVMSLLFLTPAYMAEALKTGKIPKTDFTFFAFILLFSVVVLWHGLQSSDKTLMTWHLVSIAQSLSVFLLCKPAFASSDKVSPVISIAWLLATISILTITIDGRFSLRETADDVGSIPSYQTFALCYMVTSIFMANTINHRKIRYAIHAVALVCLYLNSARSEFAGYIFFIGILEFLSYKNKSTPVILATIILGLSFTAIITGVVELPESRITALADLKQDNSSNERDRMARDGMEKIFESPLTGAYGEYEEGGYIHNIMSVWQETGFLGALFFLFMLGVPVAKLISAIIAEQSSHKDNVAISILLTAILLLIAGKYFTYLLVPAALAAYSCLNKNRYPLASDNKI